MRCRGALREQGESAGGGALVKGRQPFDFEAEPPDGAGLELSFRAGPRYLLELGGELPADATQLEAWLLTASDGAQRSRGHVSLTGGRPWVRFDALPAHLSPATELELALGDSQSMLFGAATVSASTVEPVAIELARTGALDVVVERATPLPEEQRGYQGSSRIEVHPIGAPLEGPAARFRLTRRAFLPPGVYRVSALTRVDHEVEALVKVAERERTKVVLRFGEPLPGRRVHGEVRVPEALGEVGLDIGIWSATDPRRRWFVEVPPGLFWCATTPDLSANYETEGDELVARFTIEGVPAGELVVEPLSIHAPIEWRVQELAHGDARLELAVLAELEPPGYGFLVRHAGTGDADPRVVYWVHTRAHDGGPALHRYSANGRLIAAGDPRERRFEWAVIGNGTRPVYGTQQDFERGPDGRSFARVVLEPGYGTRILARDAGSRPLAGVEVHADGELLGRTDARGELELAREHAPGRFEFRYADWRLLHGSVHPAGPLERPSAWHEIVLGP